MELSVETLLYDILHWSSGMNWEAGGAGGLPERIKHNLTFAQVWFPHRQRTQVLPAGMCSDMALRDRCADRPVSCYVKRLAGSKGQGYYTSGAPRGADVEASWNVMAHAQKPDFVFGAKRTSPFKSAGGRQFIRLLAAEVCTSAVVTLDTPCFEVVWRVLATHCI